MFQVTCPTLSITGSLTPPLPRRRSTSRRSCRAGRWSSRMTCPRPLSLRGGTKGQDCQVQASTTRRRTSKRPPPRHGGRCRCPRRTRPHSQAGRGLGWVRWERMIWEKSIIFFLLFQSRVRECLVNLLNTTGQKVGLPKSPSVSKLFISQFDPQPRYLKCLQDYFCQTQDLLLDFYNQSRNYLIL